MPEEAGVRRDAGVRGDAGVPEDAGTAEGSGGAERFARVVLSRVVEPGDAVLGEWIAARGPVEVCRALREDRRPRGLSEERWAGLRLRAARADPERDLAMAAACGARFVSPECREWPGQLDDLGTERPVGLWVRGPCSLRLLALRSVAVVGARACTDYGSHVAADLCASLARRGWTVVSGAAYGVDGAAHRGALTAEGATVAVLACGVDVCYPSGHRQLVDRIAEQGLLVSELPPGDHPTRVRFLQRNRVLAALTRGTVVVEAASRSGALVTARHAERLGRHVMGVAGSVYSAQSQGVHQLLRAGASLVTGAGEVIELAGRMGELAEEESVAPLPRDLLARGTARVLDALPARGRARLRDVAEAACSSEGFARARLSELCALGFAEREGEGWRLARPPRAGEGRGRGPGD